MKNFNKLLASLLAGLSLAASPVLGDDPFKPETRVIVKVDPNYYNRNTNYKNVQYYQTNQNQAIQYYQIVPAPQPLPYNSPQYYPSSPQQGYTIVPQPPVPYQQMPQQQIYPSPQQVYPQQVYPQQQYPNSQQPGIVIENKVIVDDSKLFQRRPQVPTINEQTIIIVPQYPDQYSQPQVPTRYLDSQNSEYYQNERRERDAYFFGRYPGRNPDLFYHDHPGIQRREFSY